MKHLANITHTTLGLPEKPLTKSHKKRRAARAIILNDKNEVALIYTHKHGHHKLPGGGLEDGEDWQDAVKREAIEEAGCTIEIIKPIGAIYEERTEHDFAQTSFCALARLKSKLEHAALTQDEIEEGYEPAKWYPPLEALSLIKADQPKTYVGKFMHARDLMFVEEAVNRLLK